jgi:hypothetical protein
VTTWPLLCIAPAAPGTATGAAVDTGIYLFLVMKNVEKHELFSSFKPFVENQDWVRM